MASLDDLPDPVRLLRDQAEDDREQAIVDALIEAEQSGVSPRTVRDILAAVREETTGPA